MSLILELCIHTFNPIFLGDEDYELLRKMALTCKQLASSLEERRLIVCYRKGMGSIHKKLNQHLENCDSYTSHTLLAFHGKLEKKSWFKFEWIEGTSEYWIEIL